jgi:hypothetical protein
MVAGPGAVRGFRSPEIPPPRLGMRIAKVGHPLRVCCAWLKTMRGAVMPSGLSPNRRAHPVPRHRVAAALATVLCHECEEACTRLTRADGTEEVVAAVTAVVIRRRNQRRQGK